MIERGPNPWTVCALEFSIEKAVLGFNSTSLVILSYCLERQLQLGPPAIHRPASSTPPHIPWAVREELCLSSSPALSSLSCHKSFPPSVRLRTWIPVTEGSVAWQPSQKAFMALTQHGAGIYSAPSSVSYQRFQAPPRRKRKIHCPCSLQL